MRVDEFDFELPEDRIALRPARPRDAARLLHVRADGTLSDAVMRDLPDLLRPGDLLVLNDTRTIRAALRATRPARAQGGGGPVEVDLNLFERMAPDVWRAFARPAKRLRAGDALAIDDALAAEITDKGEAGEVTLRFSVSGAALDQAVERAGAPPLPPYIARKRAVDAQDVDDYQTVFARAGDSVAAPTAGLHFTPELLERIAARAVRSATVTLHVGAGTFLPVSAPDTKDHAMHAERYEVTAEAAAAVAETRARGGRVVAVGTTALRALESAAREDGADGALVPGARETALFITPGYRFRAVDVLMTNFHLPRSTLFMLACAFSGTARMKAAYAHAVETGYRFYSYGDACLLERAD